MPCDKWQSGGYDASFSRAYDGLYNPYKVRVRVKDTVLETSWTATKTVHVALEPLEPSLDGNWPNPFNPATVIRFTLPEAMSVSVAVYDAVGREVHRMAHSEFAAGSHEVSFDGSSLPSGVYFYTVRMGSHSKTRSMLLIK